MRQRPLFFAVCHGGRQRQSLCHQLSFAVRHGRQICQMAHLSGSTGGRHVPPLPSATDGKGVFAVRGGRQRACTASFILFFLYPTIITGNISQQIYHRSQHIYIQHNKYPAHIYPYIHSRLHIVPSIHTYYNMQSFIIASEQNTRSASKEKTSNPS